MCFEAFQTNKVGSKMFQDPAADDPQIHIFHWAPPFRNRGTFAQHHVESLDLDATCVDCVQASFPGISDQEVWKDMKRQWIIRICNDV